MSGGEGCAIADVGTGSEREMKRGGMTRATLRRKQWQQQRAKTLHFRQNIDIIAAIYYASAAEPLFATCSAFRCLFARRTCSRGGCRAMTHHAAAV